MFKKKAHVPFVRAIMLALLTVTGWMTWSSLTTILGGTGMALLVSVIALLAFEGNLVMGPILHRGAGSEKQKTYALLLVAIGVIGVSLGATMEVMINNGEAAVLLAYVKPILPYAVIFVIIGTVVLYLAYEWADPDHELASAEQDADNAERMANLIYKQKQAQALIKQAEAAAPDAAEQHAGGIIAALNKRYGGGGKSNVNGESNDAPGPLSPPSP